MWEKIFIALYVLIARDIYVISKTLMCLELIDDGSATWIPRILRIVEQ